MLTRRPVLIGLGVTAAAWCMRGRAAEDTLTGTWTGILNAGVQLRLKWRLEPLETSSCVLLEASYTLNGAASFRRRHWDERIHGHCSRMLGALRPQIAAAQRALSVAGPSRAAPQMPESWLIPALRARRN